MKYPKMKPEWKRKWLKALESGGYKQTRGALRSSRDGFCCLGVLCDVVEPKSWKRDMEPADEDGPVYWLDWTHHGEEAGLPEEIGKRAGLKDADAVNDLIGLNDNSKASLKQIAAWIRKNL